MKQSHLYIGLMSGTSADAIDAALVDMEGTPRLIATYTHPLSSPLRQAILQLCAGHTGEIDLMGSLDVDLAHAFAGCTLELLRQTGLNASDICAIGSHGQTIRHRPRGNWTQGQPFTLQIGDPNSIAYITGITTVADFRRKDLAAGGQGAPLVPAFHRALFQSPELNRAIINLGGMANITWLPATGEALGYDTGPGNVLMDTWIEQYQGQRFDRDGQWAASAAPDSKLLARLKDHDYFQQPAPKSTGREMFNRIWLKQTLDKLSTPLNPAVVQSTLLQLTVDTVCQEVKKLGTTKTQIVLCGGGAYNLELKRRLASTLGHCQVCTTQEFGVDPQWIEAMAFAWLAHQTIQHLPGNLCAVTGAEREVILGGIYLPG